MNHAFWPRERRRKGFSHANVFFFFRATRSCHPSRLRGSDVARPVGRVAGPVARRFARRPLGAAVRATTPLWVWTRHAGRRQRGLCRGAARACSSSSAVRIRWRCGLDIRSHNDIDGTLCQSMVRCLSRAAGILKSQVSLRINENVNDIIDRATRYDEYNCFRHDAQQANTGGSLIQPTFRRRIA